MLIKDIKVNKRFRKDLGDLESLKVSIQKNGLLHPVVVDEKANLIAGFRRLVAFKELGFQDVPATVVNPNNKTEAEFDENTKRKDFTPSEAVAIWDSIDKPSGGAGKTRSDSDGVREKAAKATGKSTDTLSKAKRVIESGNEVLVKKMDKTGNVNKAYKELRSIERKQSRQAKIQVPKEVEVKIKNGDFRELIGEIPDNSVQLVLTDPPYPKEYLPLWEDLAKHSARILKPGGFLVAYSGQAHLPEVILGLKKHLEYYWLMGLYHKGPTGQRFEVNMWNRFKPILVFYKKPLKKQEQWIEDMVVSEAQDKDFHEWGQGVSPLLKLIEAFSNLGDIVCDPFFGGGSTIEAAVQTKRNVYGYEKDKKYFDLVSKRFVDRKY